MADVKSKTQALFLFSGISECGFTAAAAVLLGATAAGAGLDWRLVVALLANGLALSFAFMIARLEESPEDALDSSRSAGNPVASGGLTPLQGTRAALVFALGALGLSVFLGNQSFLYTLMTLVLGLAYSHHSVQLKKIAGLDLASHGLLFGGFQFLSAYDAFLNVSSSPLLFPLSFVVFLSIYWQIEQQIRSMPLDWERGFRNTALSLGYRRSQTLAIVFLCIAVACGILAFAPLKILPAWVLVMFIILTLIMLLPLFARLHSEPAYKGEIQSTIRQALEKAATISLAVYFLAAQLTKLII